MLKVLLNLFFGQFFTKIYITILGIDIHGYSWGFWNSLVLFIQILQITLNRNTIMNVH